MSDTSIDAGAGRKVPISRRRALALLGAVPAALALVPTLPALAAPEPEPAPWPPAFWDFNLLWHEPLTADELAWVRRIVDLSQAHIVRQGWAERWIEADEWGHVTLTWDYSEGATLLEALGILWQASMSKRRVPFSVSYKPIPGPRTEAQWAIAKERHRTAMARM